DEDHVDVADVVQLPAAALAHRDDRQPGGVRGELAGGDGQGGAEGVVGETGQQRHHVLDVAAAGQVVGGDGEQGAAVGELERGDGGVRADPQDRVVQVRPLPRRGGQVVTERGRGAQDRRQPG